MAVRPTERKQGTIAAVAASLVLTAWIAAPALAAPAHESLCDKTHDATLEVSETQLTAIPVSHDTVETDSAAKVDVLSADHLLKPRVEATVREVFADSDDETKAAEDVQTEADDPVIMNTRVPGVSDDELARFKRQMYRKDI